MKGNKWILASPWLIFGVAVALFSKSENEVWLQFNRAQTSWRAGDYDRAIELYEKVYSQYPRSSYAAEALWELGTLNYINSANVDRALEHFQILVTEYPNSPRSIDAYLMLGEIHDIELQDPAQAIACWRTVLERAVSREQRRRLLFRVGNAYFKQKKFEQARQTYQQLIADGAGDDLAHQANIRLGTIFQLAGAYQKSIPCFRAVLEAGDAHQYRLQAQLGLIESYEFLDDLPAALAVARGIGAEDCPAEMRRDLLARLHEQEKLYGPSKWISGSR